MARSYAAEPLEVTVGDADVLAAARVTELESAVNGESVQDSAGAVGTVVTATVDGVTLTIYEADAVAVDTVTDLAVAQVERITAAQL